MKKYLKRALIFAIFGLLCGVYFREFTKIKGFTGNTMLAKVHPHVLLLGFAWFLIVAIFVKVLNIEEDKKTKVCNIIYLCGLGLSAVMMLTRGTMEVMGVDISKTTSTVISIIAGIGHMALAAGIIRFTNLFIKASEK